jgi:hypothetical protein
MTHTYRLHVVANYPDEVEEDYSYKTAYEVDDLLGIVKTYLEYADKATSFVITLVREEVPEHKVEGTQANFDRYIAGDR